jgi:hypothetical protein
MVCVYDDRERSWGESARAVGFGGYGSALFSGDLLAGWDFSPPGAKSGKKIGMDHGFH